MNSGTVTIPPDLLNLHPGCDGQYSIVRWTAPAAGLYQIQGRFQGNDHFPGGTDVHIRLNSSTALFDNAVIGYGPLSAIPFSLARQLNAGDTIDFAVGYGADGHFDNDSTGLAATITLGCLVPPSGMVSWWAGDGNALDIQGANNGAAVGGAVFGSGEVGQAFSMSYPGYIDIPHASNLNPAGGITIDAWVYANGLNGSFQTIIKKADETHGYALELDQPSEKVSFFMFLDNGAGSYGWERAMSNTALSVNTWYHVAGSFDGSALRIYINGILENSFTPTNTGIDWSNNNLNIGTDPSHQGDPSRYWNGLIDEVEIFNRALSGAEIASLYNAGSAGKCKPGATALSVSPVSYTYGGNATLQATLTRASDSTAVSGETVNFTLNGNASGSAVTDASGIAAMNLTGVISVNAATYPNGVGASFAGDGSIAASSGTAYLRVDQASQTITFGALTDKTFGDPDFSVSATASSGLAVTFTVGATDNCTILGTTVHITGAGSCTVTAHQAGDTNYNAATDVPRTFSIHKAAQTITFSPLANLKLSQSPVTVSATASPSDLPVTFTTTTPPVCTSGGTRGATITLLATGTCTVVAHQAGDTNYSAAADAPQSFTVGNGKADQTITFAALVDKTLAQSPVTVSATASSNLAVTFTTTTPAVCTAGGKSGATISLVAAGTCTVQAAQAGGPNYNPAPSVARSFTVTKADQTITFAAPAPKTLAQSPVAVSATATSGLAVTFTTTTTAVCTATGKNGATIKLVAVGTCTVKADQIGNAAYNAATSVTQSFSVTP